MADTTNADAWGLPRVLDFFAGHRNSAADVYPSEWFFLKDRLREGITVLDIGCAQGGFASVLKERLTAFEYTGIDINADMIARARALHPGAVFHHVREDDFSVLGSARFDLVLILGILHLHESWRNTIAAAWAHTHGSLILDLREIEGPSIEDKARSWFRMDFNGGGEDHGSVTLPYNIINAGEALAAVAGSCPDAAGISHYGYRHPVSRAAVTPVDTVMATVWCIERRPGNSAVPI